LVVMGVRFWGRGRAMRGVRAVALGGCGAVVCGALGAHAWTALTDGSAVGDIHWAGESVLGN